MAPIPLIYSPRIAPMRMTWLGRAFAAVMSLGCMALLVTAALLKPDPSGMGTHLALGLAPCGFLQATGLPCPTCGMTTSWAWFARGNLAASVWVQPMGTLLALLTAMVFWSAGYIAVSGRAAHHLIRYVPTGYILHLLLALTLAAWAWKTFIHLHHLDGWK
jgi:Protein of unknown function (DUF2752)